MNKSYSFSAYTLFVFIVFLIFGSSLPAQTPYSYTPESFEDTVWATAASSSNAINAVTGTWTTASNNIRSTATPAQDGVYSLYISTKSNALTSPKLQYGAGVLTYYVNRPSGGGRRIFVATSKDKLTWSAYVDSFDVPSVWTLRRVAINDTAVKYVKFYTNSNGSVYIDNMLITSPGAAGVSVTTNEVTNINQRSAVVGGTISNDGSATILSSGVCYNSTGYPDTSSTKVVFSELTGQFSSPITNLTPGATYYVMAYAVSSIGVKYGNLITFKTLEDDAPIAYWTQPFNNVTQFPQSSPTDPVSINVDGQGTWIFYKAYKGSNPAYINDGSAYDLRMLKSGSYVITPVLTDGVTALTYMEGRGNRVLNIYTSIDTGATWTLFQADTTSKIDINTILIKNASVNRIKIANESDGDEDVDNISVTVFPIGQAPTVETTIASGIGKNTASSGGNVSNAGTKSVVARGICWSTSQFPLVADNVTLDGIGSGAFTSALTGLPAGTLIHYRAYASSRSGTGYGIEYTFTTLPATIPVVATIQASTITAETALSGGTVTDGGGAPIAACGICWNTSGNPSTADAKTLDTVKAGAFRSLAVKLTPDTKYFYRVYASNIAGTGYGEIDTLTTGSLRLPAVSTSETVSIYSYKATGAGNVTDDGNAPVIRGVCINTTGNPNATDRIVLAGNSAGAFNCIIGNLHSSTKYYVRAFVTNSAGTVYGEELSFTTLASTSKYASPYGSDVSGDGSALAPYYSLQKAVDNVAPGDTIYMKGGTYTYTLRVNINKSGTTDGGGILVTTLNGERALLDFSSMVLADSNQGIRLSGSYWHFYGLDVKGAGDNGMLIERNKPTGGTYTDVKDRVDEAHNNTIENCTFLENRDTGLQLKNLAENNRVINCDSYYNCDPDMGDADGFAPKLTVGTGNYFYGCRAWQNSDDGWDGLLTTADNGFPDNITTTIINCWSFMNGFLKDGSAGKGNGNGFKLGGAGSYDERHNMILNRCLAFDNLQKGFDQNHNQGSMTLINCTGFAKPYTGNKSHYTYRIDGTILAPGKQLIHTNNVAVWDGLPAGDSQYAPCEMIGGVKTTCDYLTSASDYLSVDTLGVRGSRAADGSLPNVAFMHLKKGNTKLIDAGTPVEGILFEGTAPDLGAFEYSNMTDVKSNTTKQIPYEFSLAQNYPNPFNPSTTITFTLEKDGLTTLKIYDILGCEVKTLINERLQSGVLHTVRFNAANLSSGVYFYCLESGQQKQIKKLLLLK